MTAPAVAQAQTAQTITFAALSGKTYGNPPFTVSATASSGLAVSFSSQTTSICTVSGSTVTIVAAGSCTIRASQSGNAVYAPAPNVDRSFTVAKAAQTITFATLAGKTFGNPPFTVSATASSGLAVSFSSTTTSKCTVSGSTVTIVAAGTCTIRASQAGNGNYNAAPNVDRSFTIAKASQTISFTAPPSTRLDQTPVTVSATATSGLAVTFSSTTTAVCTVSGTTVTLKIVGTCTIRAAQAGNANWNAAANVDRSFPVTKGNQTITFAALSNRALGTGTFSVSATASSALAVAFSSTSTAVCTVSGTTVTMVSVGTCTIRSSQAGNANWNAATPVDQSFSVTKGNQTISFSTVPAKTFGIAPFTVSATATSGQTVSFASLSASVCTVSGNTVTLVAGGACTLRASQPGNANWNAASDVEQTFPVQPGNQTITFAPLQARAWGIAPFSISASASSGLPIVFLSQAPNVCSVTQSTVTLLGVGTCTILATQAGNASYSPANAQRSFPVIGPVEFAPPISYAVLDTPADVALGDVNTDGKVDVVAVGANTSTGHTVAVAAGNGTGAIGVTARYSVGVAKGFRVALGDINSDGRMDLVVARDEFANDESGVVQFFLGQPGGAFTTGATLNVGIWPTSVRLADLDNDGKLDLVVTNGRASLSWAVGDTLQIFRGKGDGSFHPSTIYPTGYDTRGVAIADFNGDGKLDLISITSGGGGGFPGSYTVLLGNGDATFSLLLTAPTGLGTESIGAGDFNGDGKADFAIANSGSYSIGVYLGRGDGTFTGPSNVPVPEAGSDDPSFELLVEDFNVDGRPDLAVATTYNGIVILAGLGDGTFTGPFYVDSGAYPPKALATGDLNGDGRPDLVVDGAHVILNTGAVQPGYSLTIQAGSPQSANAGTAYLTRFKVLLKNGAGQPVVGDSVLFSAPGVGPSGSFAGSGTFAQVTTDATGVAQAPTFTANATAGAFAVVASSGTASALFLLTNVGAGSQAPVFITGPPPAGTVNLPYSFNAVASGSPPPTYSVLPNAFPPGLNLAGSTGVISGTPTTAGTFAGMLTASNAVAPDANQAFAINISLNSQTITFPAMASVAYGIAPFALAATASSGLSVSFASTTPTLCTVLNTTLSILAPGTCTIQATQPGDNTYAAAPPVNRSVTVTKASQEIAFGGLFNRFLGSGTFSVAATASSGLPVSFTSLTTGICTLSGSTVTLLGVGTCTIRAAQTGNTYFLAAANVNQSFLVQAAGTNQPPTVTLLVPKNGGTFASPAVIPLLASVTDTDGSVVRVEFYEGTTLLGVSTSPPFRYVWRNVTTGSYSITAKAFDDRGTAVTSSAAVINVAILSQPLFFVTYPDLNGDIHATGMVAIDINSDAKLDLLAATSSGSAYRYLGDGSGGFATGSTTNLDGAGCNTAWGDAETGDFNNDAKADLIAISSLGCVAVLMSNGNGTLAPAVHVGGLGQLNSIAVADLNADGKADVVVGETGGNVRVLLGNGNGTFLAPTTVAFGTNLVGVVLTDLDNDGRPDIVVTSPDDGTIRVSLGNGNGTFQSPQTVLVGASPIRPNGLRAADLDGDGKVDIVVADHYAPFVTVLMGNGNGTFQSGVEYPAGQSPVELVIADFDGDLKLDVAVVNDDEFGTISILAGNGDGTLRQPFAIGIAPRPMYLLTADLNADGRPDIAATSPFGATILINSSGLTLQAPVITSSPLLPGITTGSSYSFQFTATGVPAPVFSLEPGANFPASMLSSGGLLSSAAFSGSGLVRGTVRASNGVPPDATQEFTFVVSRKSQSINFASQANAFYTPVCNTCTRTATATSGLPVTVRSLTPTVCSVASNGDFSTITVGTCTLRAEQAGDHNYLPAPNVDRTFQVIPKPPAVAISAPLDHAAFGAPASIAIEATVSAYLPPTLGFYVYKVEFFANDTWIGVDYTAPYSTTWNNVAAGTHKLVARSYVRIDVGGGSYGEDVQNSAPVTVVVGGGASSPVVAIASPASGAEFPFPASVPLSANASVSSGTILSVSYFNGAAFIGSASAPPYTFNWANAPPGNYSITARATSSLGVVGRSAPVNVRVGADRSSQIDLIDFNAPWSSIGRVAGSMATLLGTRMGSVSQLAAPPGAPKPDTCSAGSFSGGVVDFDAVPASAAAAATSTVAFWARWNGIDEVTLLSWGSTSLRFSGGGIGFSTDAGDLYGATSAGLANAWRFVVAEITNGNVQASRLWIGGVEQALSQRAGSPQAGSGYVGSQLRLGGLLGASDQRFQGQLDDVSLFHGALSAAHRSALANRASPCAPVSVALLQPIDGEVLVAPATIDLAAMAWSSDGSNPFVRYYKGSSELPWFDPRAPNLEPGTYQFTATATVGSTTVTSAPVTVTVIAGPSSLATASLAHPAPGATLYTSSTTHLLPSITTPQDLNIARVDYYADGQPIGYRTQPPFHHWRHLLAPGSYVLTAKITDDHGFVTTTAPVTVNIVNGAPSVVYYHADAAGSPVAATDQAGSLVWIEDYRPWGERNLSLESGTTNGLWYTGKPIEDATGLVYLGARWYSPEIGRFYGVDPVDFAPDKPKSFNRYAYGNNNPYRFVDPDGQVPVLIYGLALLGGASWGLHSTPANAPRPGEAPLSQSTFDNAIAIAGATPIGKVGSAVASTASLTTTAVAGYGFRSHSSLVRFLGPAGAGKEWHHIVGQTKSNIAKFGPEAVHNTSNVIAIDAAVHSKITGFYNSIQPFSEPQRVRTWVGNQTFEQQAQFGADILRRFGIGSP